MHQSGVEQQPRGTAMSILLMVRNGGMPLLAVLLAVTFAYLVCG